MKLVEILARELEKWPDDAEHAYQDSTWRVYFSKGDAPVLFEDRNDWDVSPRSVNMVRCDRFGDVFALATDHTTAIITREMWEAERAKLKEGKTVKENKDGWIRHRGGKCPSNVTDRIDVRFRDGEIGVFRCPITLKWVHEQEEYDIMAWRPHKPEQPDIYADEPVAGESVTVEFVDSVIGQLEGPLSWRDRIHEIDAASKEEESRHCAAMEAFDKERAELVAKLAAEGLALVEREEVAPAEDMSDCRKWRVGDIIEVIKEGMDEAERGELLKVFKLDSTDEDQPVGLDGKDSRHWPVVSDGHLSLLKWHSRPTA